MPWRRSARAYLEQDVVLPDLKVGPTLQANRPDDIATTKNAAAFAPKALRRASPKLARICERRRERAKGREALLNCVST